jgi:hypothetical protein
MLYIICNMRDTSDKSTLSYCHSSLSHFIKGILVIIVVVVLIIIIMLVFQDNGGSLTAAVQEIKQCQRARIIANPTQ